MGIFIVLLMSRRCKKAKREENLVTQGKILSRSFYGLRYSIFHFEIYGIEPGDRVF